VALHEEATSLVFGAISMVNSSKKMKKKSSGFSVFKKKLKEAL